MLESKAYDVAAEPSQIKNIVLLIGDGMGPQQVGLLEEYATRAPQSIYRGNNSAISKLANLGVTGLSLHGPADKLVVDSACSATQLATGVASGSEMIGLNRAGQKIPTILQKAKAMGKSTGLVSDTRLTHATPAAFATHQIHRSMENAIAEQMVVSNSVDVMLSGGLRHFIPKDYMLSGELDALETRLAVSGLSLKSKRRDRKNILRQAESQGYELVFNEGQLQDAHSERILGLFANSAMVDGIEASNQRYHGQPSLRNMTQVAINKLAKNPKGFFLMVEGGQIDWAGHNNDAGTLLHEMIKFDSAVDAVLQWAKDRDDTLVILTADHETGGFGFSYSGADLPQAEQLDNLNGDIYKPNYNFGELTILDKLYLQKRSYSAMWKAAKHDDNKPSADKLVQTVNLNSEFKINDADANTILAEQKNAFFKRGHKSLGVKIASKIHDFSPFYVYLNERPLNLIGRALSTKQNIVWSTGTHTHTPVGVFVLGPEHAIKQFSGFYTHVELGKKMKQILTGY
ncbi:alkaline phosphatase [Pseudoalteromonas umbrosa]|uniref:alkaline phosphatase n=1 Tax=Pseudoalteromonas umbrosa TaxID=3048489 RepID=UPI0024C36221|nr:alkaline phosphatase [Pseudoalteromonas sp. B95]MDK1287959.1 alkaline phosphatase [Pseudoalteromonas sp. B95]